jgi:hypothetical protein
MSTFNLTAQTNLFKINYYKKSENMYNSATVLLGKIKKRYDFTGKQRFVAIPTSFSGGVGSGSLPTANPAEYEGAVITAKKVYAVTSVDRETMKASQGNEGAFVEATKECVKKTVEAWMRNCSRILFGDGTGTLGIGDDAGANVTGNGTTATPYIIQLSSAFNEANFEENDLVNINAETTNLEIVAVDVAAKKVSLVGSSTRLGTLAGANPFAAADSVFMQGSKNNDPIGLKKIKDFTIAATGTLYNVPFGRRWSMTVKDAQSAGISTDLMNEIMLSVEKKSGKSPDLIMSSYEQFRKMLALMEDHKRYAAPARYMKGQLSFEGVEFMSVNGPVGIFCDRFCAKDEVWFLNSEYIEVHHRPGFGWFDDDGTVFLRSATSDEYEARYGGYYENFITPTFHGVIYGLAV